MAAEWLLCCLPIHYSLTNMMAYWIINTINIQLLNLEASELIDQIKRIGFVMVPHHLSSGVPNINKT